VSPTPNRVLEVLPDEEAVARRAAEVVAAAAREAIAASGRFTFALSGGRTPWTMFRDLADEDVPWEEVGIWQVDERVAPDGDPDRNITGLIPVIPSGVDLRGLGGRVVCHVSGLLVRFGLLLECVQLGRRGGHRLLGADRWGGPVDGRGLAREGEQDDRGAPFAGAV